MARAGHELDAEALEVVVGVVERMYLELAAVARARVDLADRQRGTEDVQEFALDARRLVADGVAGIRRWLGADAGAGDLSEEASSIRDPAPE